MFIKFHLPSETKVADLDPSLSPFHGLPARGGPVYQDVCGLEVPVEDPPGVHVVQCAHQVGRYPPDLLVGHRTTLAPDSRTSGRRFGLVGNAVEVASGDKLSHRHNLMDS